MSDMISREAAIAAAASCPDRYWGSWVAECLHALPAVQPDAREAARLLDDIVCGRGMFGLDPAQDLQWAMETAAAALALIDKPGKEVMPVVSHVSPTNPSDTAPAGLSAGGGAEAAAKVLRTLEKQTAHGQRAEHSRIGHCFNEASWHIHLAGFRSRGEAQAALDAILAAQPATKGSE